MSSFPILDLVIGIIFIYFLLSIICSSAVELFLSIFKSRAGLLENWLKQIFNQPALDSEGKPLNVSVGQAIMDHCMVTALAKKGTSTSYIDSENFVSALLDKITIAPSGANDDKVELPPVNLADYITAIQNSTLISGELKRTILIFANEASQAAAARSAASANITAPVVSELELFRNRLEKWFNTNADRLTGTFKRTKALPLTIIIAVIMVISLNTDSVEIGKYLYNNQAVSKELATTAMNSFQNYQAQMDTLFKKDSVSSSANPTNISDLKAKTSQLKNDLDSLHALDLPIGWKAQNIKDRKTFMDYFIKHLAGWMATILAIMMGAPFWFDILNKISNLRGTGPKPVSNSGAAVKDD